MNQHKNYNKIAQNSRQVYNIQHLLNKNYDAFKKNKQNKENIKEVNFMDLTDTSTRKKHQQSLRTQVAHLRQARSNAIQSYEFAITHLQQMVKSLIQKNQFLNKDRHTILKQNYELKTEVQFLKQQLKIKKERQTKFLKNQVFNLNGLLQSGNIFQEYICDEQTLDPMRSSTSDEANNYQKNNQGDESYQYSSQNNRNNNIQNQIFQSKKHSKASRNHQGLIRQVSNEILVHPSEDSSNQLQSEPQTPNYNDFGQHYESNLNSPKLNQQHYLEMNQDLISYKGESSQECSSNKQVQISLNNANNMFKNSLQLNLKFNESDPSSNSKYIQQFKNNLHTPALPETSQYMTVTCSANCYEGVFRAFYLSVLQSDKMLKILKKIIQDLRHDQQFIIYQIYPTNNFWVDMLLSFINIVQQGRYENEMQILDHINSHKLYDILFIQCLKSRVQFLFGDVGVIDKSYQSQSEEQTKEFQNSKISQKKQQQLKQISIDNSKLMRQKQEQPLLTPLQLMKALSNEFDLRLQINQSEYAFFQRPDKHDEYLLHSERQSLQISLNNKEQCRFYTTDEQPIFRIVLYQGNFYFNLNIRKRQISEYILNSNATNSRQKLNQNLQNSLKGYSNSNENYEQEQNVLGSDKKKNSQQFCSSGPSYQHSSFAKQSPQFNQNHQRFPRVSANEYMRQFDSFQEQKQTQTKNRSALKQKKIDFNSTCFYGPIRQQSLQKMTSSCEASKNVSRSNSKRFVVKRQAKNLDQMKRQDIYSSDYFLKKVKSSESGDFFNNESGDFFNDDVQISQVPQKKLRHYRN